MMVVVINSGSSSVKYEVFETSDFPVLSSGLLEPSLVGTRKESRRTKMNFLVTGLTGTQPPMSHV